MARATMKKQKLGAVQRKWLKALRSGKYKQTNGRLRDSDGFCCLGVACEVLGLLHNDNHVITTYRSGKASSATVMPGSSWRHLGLYGNGGKAQDDEGDLTDLNDCGISFKRIATKIERDPSVYFKSPL